MNPYMSISSKESKVDIICDWFEENKDEIKVLNLLIEKFRFVSLCGYYLSHIFIFKILKIYFKKNFLRGEYLIRNLELISETTISQYSHFLVVLKLMTIFVYMDSLNLFENHFSVNIFKEFNIFYFIWIFFFEFAP